MRRLDIALGRIAIVAFAGLGCGSDRDASSGVAGSSSSGAAAQGTGSGGAPPIGSIGRTDPTPPPPACERVELRDFLPEAARFGPNGVVTLRAQLSASDLGTCRVNLNLEITHIGAVVHSQAQTMLLSPGIEQTAVLRWRPPARDFLGYMARLAVEGSSIERNTGIDISSNALVFPRYGYISVFPPDQANLKTQQIVSTLAERYHINLFQLYDWFWRHEDLLPRAPDGSVPATWTDLFGRSNSLATIRDLVAAIHSENGLALGYVTMYAAREGYEQLSGIPPAWGVFTQPAAQTQVSLAFGAERYLFLFDPSNPRWQARMASEYVEAVDELSLDGVQIDQFGPRPTLYRANGTPLELRETFAPFLEAIDNALTVNDPNRAVCTFNLVDGAVNGYAVDAITKTSACDILYSEIWFTTDTYEELRAYIEQLRRLGGRRPVVLALYPQYGEDVGVMLQPEDAELSGVAVDTDHPGYTGSGFIDQFDSFGDSITWNADFEQDPTVSFVFRYSNATGNLATRTLLIDGVPVGKLMFPSRASWDEWAFDAWIQQQVTPGRHEVTLLFGSGDLGAVNIDRLTLGAFSEASVRLQNAVVFASGATPIQIGDDVQSLSHEYFPNRSKTLRPSLREALRAQYSFITAHETLLFAPTVEPIDVRLARIRALSSGHALIAEGSGGIWTVLRSSPDGEIIHLVNLVGVDNQLWRDPAPQPIVQERISLRYEVEDPNAVREVLWATPDRGPGTFSQLAFTRGERCIEFEVPRLTYWDVVLVRYRPPGPAAAAARDDSAP